MSDKTKVGNMDLVLDVSNAPYTIIENALLECNLNIYDKMLLILLKKCAGKACKAYPGKQTLAKWMGCSPRTVQRSLRRLEQAQLLKIIRRKNQTNLYFLGDYILTEGYLQAVWPESLRGDRESLGGDRESPQGETERHPKNKREKYSLKNKSSSSNKTIDKETMTIFERWTKIFGQSVPEKHRASLKRYADYMLYLYEKGELPEIRKPVAYLKQMKKNGIAEQGWPDYKKREEQRLQAHLKKVERLKKEKEEIKKAAQLRQEWEALPEEEKEKIATLASKDKTYRLISPNLRPYLYWLKYRKK